MYLLDTNIISELRRARPHGGVLAWILRADERQMYVSAVSLGEIQAGIEGTREQDKVKADEIEAWADVIPRRFHVLPMDVGEFREWARLMHRKPAALYEDALIAATARVHGMTVVTRNIRDFRAFDVELLNPFETR